MKVRLFAMVDVFTQWILKPIHDYIFDILVVLRRMQLLINMQPFVEYRSTLKKGELAFSYDLSSATDRLPIQLQIHLLSWIYPGLGEN